MHPLDGPRLKVKRAHEHLRALDGNLRRFYDLKPYSLFKDVQPDKPYDIVRIRIAREPKPRIGLSIGEFAYNLRSALDQTAYALATRDGSELPDDDRTEFPIFDREPTTKDALSAWAGRTGRIGKPDSEEMIFLKSLQPYTRGNRAHTHPLWGLNIICNRDKHRAFPVVGHQLTIALPPVPFLGSVVVNQMFNDNDVVSMVGKAVDPKHKFNPIHTAEIVFEVGNNGLRASMPNFTTIYEFVRDQVLPGCLSILEK